jgi:hypothetical protein
MAITPFRRTVTTAATLLASNAASTAAAADWAAVEAILINASTTPATVVLGGSTVTASTGARWIVGVGSVLRVTLEPGESIYGIVASGTQDIDVLVSGR